jgi:sorting nexin-1/2
MSGFDDLLKQSSRALEENPFEDPFAPARSNSPDPWSSYTHQSVAPTSSGFEYGESGFSGQSPTTPTVESHDESSVVPPVAVESHSSSVPAALSDPLDSANLPADDKPDSATKLSTSPVFFEARHTAENDPLPDTPESPVQQTFPSEPVVSDVLPPAAPSLTLPPATSPPETSPTVQLSSPESPPSAIPAELPDDSSPQSPPPPSSARLPQRQYVPQPTVHIPFTPSSPTVSESNRVISTPLDQPPTTSFASLALGGESFNGWDGAQSTFVNNASLPSVAPQEDDDDDDDDKPLRPRPVSTSFYCLSASAAHVSCCSSLQQRQARRKLACNLCSRLQSRTLKRLGTPSELTQCTRCTPGYDCSKLGHVSALMISLSRRLPQCTPNLHFLFFAAIQTSYGCMRPFQTTILASLFHLLLKKVRLGASTISLSDSGDMHSKTA